MKQPILITEREPLNEQRSLFAVPLSIWCCKDSQFFFVGKEIDILRHGKMQKAYVAYKTFGTHREAIAWRDENQGSTLANGTVASL